MLMALRNRLLLLLPAAGLALALPLPACRRGCQEPYPLPDSFTVSFSTDTLGGASVGFRLAEVRSAYLVTYAADDLRQPLDTLYAYTGRGGNRRVLDIYSYGNSRAPSFSLGGSSRRPQERSFRLLVPRASRSYDITNVVLDLAAGSGPCPSFTITRKEATINGQRRDALTEIPVLTK